MNSSIQQLTKAQQLGTFFMTASFGEIRVVGPIDWAGMPGNVPGRCAQELAISRAWATAPVLQLQENGGKAAKLSAEWYGHIQPVVTRVDQIGRQTIYRQEIVLELWSLTHMNHWRKT
jgi:hypothetical protein